jgi:hypothetical protein
MNTRPTTPYPTDPTIATPQPGYAPADPQFKVPLIQYFRQTNVAPALGPTPSPNLIPPSGQTNPRLIENSGSIYLPHTTETERSIKPFKMPSYCI